MIHDIHVWTIVRAPDGSPRACERPSPTDMERADAVMRLVPTSRRFSIEAVRVDVGTARALAAEVLRAVHGDGHGWQEVPAADLVPAEPEPKPEKIDIGAITPAHPKWAAEARTMLAIGGYSPDAAPHVDPERAEAGRALITRALAEGWTIKKLGEEILREAAERQDRSPVDPRWHAPAPDPIAVATGTADTSASVWQRVIRAPDRERGEVSNATRRGF